MEEEGRAMVAKLKGIWGNVEVGDCFPVPEPD